MRGAPCGSPLRELCHPGELGPRAPRERPRPARKASQPGSAGAGRDPARLRGGAPPRPHPPRPSPHLSRQGAGGGPAQEGAECAPWWSSSRLQLLGNCVRAHACVHVCMHVCMHVVCMAETPCGAGPAVFGGWGWGWAFRAEASQACQLFVQDFCPQRAYWMGRGVGAQDLKEKKEVVEETENGRDAPANGNANEENGEQEADNEVDEEEEEGGEEEDEEEEGDGEEEDGDEDDEAETATGKRAAEDDEEEDVDTKKQKTDEDD
ncbi:prothymosin alpha isoform X1 [Dromiciops gliroides]|uniref:prothymosin alpha isoform X1 n=1 Tax=Dromiciops gliroides TaxID=33562 RepID=UPI001CC44BA3|nr:prothymosin alpha isoform X1 [Dromiciops gliroides]